MSPSIRESGFTLVEILVSILIFSIVSLAMMTILLTSTNVFRAGEYGRASSDEAVAALGVLDEDLKRMVPAHDGGFYFAQLHPDVGTGPPNGNCVVAFVITQPTASAISKNGELTRQVVAYWVESTSTGEDQLVRVQAPVAAEDNDVPPTVTQFDVVQKLFATPNPPVVAQRCLHFAAWVSTEAEPRNSADDWADTPTGGGLPLRPTSPNGFFCTEVAGRTGTPAVPVPDPFPTAVRFTLTLAAGRYAPTGYVVDDNGTDAIRIAGLGAVPTYPGAALRIGDEWIEYTGYAGGTISVDPAKGGMRAARRSSPPPTAGGKHLRNEKVQLGQTYSLARTFPH